MSVTSNYINLLAQKFSFSKYLEIGVRDGSTFCNVDTPHKTAVDPHFAFNTENHISDQISYFSETSDEFFKNLPKRLMEKPFNLNNQEKDFKFDIIYIDGMHTFKQSYKDFRNVINYIHDNSIIIFDDTLPRDPYSAVPNQAKSLFYRRMANIDDDPWHGDVYKTIFAIHDFHPEFCYATNISTGYPQTIVWKNPTAQARRYRFNSMSDIMALSYFDMLDNASFLVPLQFNEIFPLIGSYIDPNDYKNKVDYSKIIPRLKTIVQA